MIVQDIVDTHSREVVDLTELFIKRIINYSIPLTGMVILLGILVNMDPALLRAL